MLIPLMLALAVQSGEVKPAALGSQVQGAAPAAPSKSWFAPASQSFGSSFRLMPSQGEAGPRPDDQPKMTCVITVIKPDPKLDARMARPAPQGLDPKIVRPSPCRN